MCVCLERGLDQRGFGADVVRNGALAVWHASRLVAERGLLDAAAGLRQEAVSPARVGPRHTVYRTEQLPRGASTPSLSAAARHVPRVKRR